ncbi:MAG: hypothetical protein K0S20_138 [Patescibacteria group bacterium]|jgi:hypothetical protein|nr:hypothetical protein [Patescibacteria group bacterium]
MKVADLKGLVNFMMDEEPWKYAVWGTPISLPSDSGPLLGEAILVVALVRAGIQDKRPWLSCDQLKHISPENLEETIKVIVEVRLKHDGQIPLWVIHACEVYEANGWEVPTAWILVLKQALGLVSSGMEANAARNRAAVWLNGREEAGFTSPSEYSASIGRALENTLMPKEEPVLS